VVKSSGAEKAGIEVGDVVVEVAGNRVASLEDIQKALIDYQAGNTVRAVVRRNANELNLDVVLRLANDFNRQQYERRQLDGRKSRRRDGFKSAFQMDAILKPELCGGPVVDVTGKIIGVTLARANRVASYAVTYQDLRPVIERLMHESEVELVKTNATPAQEAE
jgi:serine protease Do